MAIPEKLAGRDMAEMLLGAVALAYPLVVTEEVWHLGQAMTWPRALALWFGSAVVIGWYGTHAFQHGSFRKNWGQIILRVLVAHGLTFAVCATLLLVMDKFPILTDPGIALRRAMIVMYPAAFAATILDSFGKK